MTKWANKLKESTEPSKKGRRDHTTVKDPTTSSFDLYIKCLRPKQSFELYIQCLKQKCTSFTVKNTFFKPICQIWHIHMVELCPLKSEC